MTKDFTLNIYRADGTDTGLVLKKYQYSGQFMGERKIITSFSSPVSIYWRIGDYVMFRGEKFKLRYIPSAKKQANRNTSGEGYVYDGMTFSSTIGDLMDIQFLDYVDNDNNAHYTGLSDFSFYVSNNDLSEFAGRLKANIERVYGKGSWNVVVAKKGVNVVEGEYVIVEGSDFTFDDQNIAISANTTVYNALCLINTQLDVNFFVRTISGVNTIIIGGSSKATEESLGYGNGRGLKSIQQSHNSNEKIVTRLHAYGSSRNLPYRYYNKKYNNREKYPDMFDSEGNYLLETRYINKLMLPYAYWVKNSQLWDAYITSSKINEIGLKEGDVTFDGSDKDWDEVYPSLEKQSVDDWYVGMTMYETGYRAVPESYEGRFTYCVMQMTTYNKCIGELLSITKMDYNVASLKDRANEIVESNAWGVSSGKMEYYEELFDIIDEVWSGKGWDYVDNNYKKHTHILTASEQEEIKKLTYKGEGRLDKFPYSTSIKDNGVSNDGDYSDGAKDTAGNVINTQFEIILPQLGFDIEDWVAQDGSKAEISVKTGMCAGRKFQINSCIAVDVDDYTKGWKLDLTRMQDTDVNMMFPNSTYQIKSGDEYVITGIYMPDIYVESAEQRLLKQAQKYLDDIDHTKYTYSLEIDSKWAYENDSIMSKVFEGCALVFNDFDSKDEQIGIGDLGVGNIAMLITNLSISYNEETLPKYSVTLSDEKQTAVSLQETINSSIKSTTISLSSELVQLKRDKLSRTADDVANGRISFMQALTANGIENDGVNITKGLTMLYEAVQSSGFKDGMSAGSGWQIDKDGNAQVESIEVRSYMRVMELIMNRLSAEESDFVFTESGTVDRARHNEDGSYTLVMRKKTDKDVTAFKVGDVIKGVVNDLDAEGSVGLTYYTAWMLVEGVYTNTNSIRVSVYPDAEAPAKKNFPPCDSMVLHRWGSIIDTERQSCWYISSAEKRIVMLDGVTKPIVDESNYASFYGLPYNLSTFKGVSLNQSQPYIYVRGAILQDVHYVDYQGREIYRMEIDQSLGGTLAPNETEEVAITIYSAFGDDVTDKFRRIDVRRNTSDEASDAVWNAKHKNVGNPFPIGFNDLGIDGISKVAATFYVTATDEVKDETMSAELDYFS